MSCSTFYQYCAKIPLTVFEKIKNKYLSYGSEDTAKGNELLLTLTLVETLTMLDEEFEATEKEYMGPRDSEDSCTNEEDIDASVTAFLPPESNSLAMNSGGEATVSSATIVPREVHRSQTSSDDCGQDLPQDCLQIERSFEDEKEEAIIEHFLERTCGCKVGSGKSPCFGLISRETITQMRNNCHQMSRSELDFTILAQLNALRTHSDAPSDCAEKHFRPTTKYFVHGLPVCQKMFCFLHTIGKDHLVNLCAFVDDNGVTERIHGNSKRTPHNATPQGHIHNI